MKYMQRKELIAYIEDLCRPLVEQYGMEIVEVEWKPIGGTWNLCLYIDKPGGVTLKDCEIINKEVSDLLDREDPIEHRYTLEVSSPGVERPLRGPRDYQRYRGSLVQITT